MTDHDPPDDHEDFMDAARAGRRAIGKMIRARRKDHREAPAPTLGDLILNLAQDAYAEGATDAPHGTFHNSSAEREGYRIVGLAERAEPDGALRVRPPTDAEVADACMWYRHDFGLLDESEREVVRFEAREWLRAWCKVRDYEMPPASAPQRAGTEGEKGGGGGVSFWLQYLAIAALAFLAAWLMETNPAHIVAWSALYLALRRREGRDG